MFRICRKGKSKEANLEIIQLNKYLDTPISTEVNIKEIRRLEAKLLNLQQKLEANKEEINSLESDKDALQETEQRLNQRNRDLENKLVALRAELDRTRSTNNANDEDLENLLKVKLMILFCIKETVSVTLNDSLCKDDKVLITRVSLKLLFNQ